MTIQSHSWLIEGTPRNSRAPVLSGGDTDLSVLRAFPGAEGGGAVSTGGRGGTVIYVTNLNDSGSGSLRAACAASGARIVVFRVSGTIALQSSIIVWNGNLTIAGYTAPGQGIQITGLGITTNWSDMFTINANDVVIQGVKIRMGWNGSSNNGACIGSTFNAHRIIVDHCSLFWSNGTTTGSWTPNGAVSNRDITWSNNIIAESLGNVSKAGANVGTNDSSAAEGMVNIDFHNNLFFSNSHRNALIKVKEARFVNNLVYNCWWYNTMIGGGCRVDLIGNRYKQGPTYNSSTVRGEIAVWWNRGSCSTVLAGNPSIYVSGNQGVWHVTDSSEDNWLMVREENCENSGTVVPGQLSTSYRRLNPLLGLTHPITATPVTNLESSLLPHVGASKQIGIDGLLMTATRDAADSRVVEWYSTGQGSEVLSHTDVGGFPSIASSTTYTCTSGDGIADGWKTRNGLNINTRYNTGPGGQVDVPGGPTIPGLNGWTYMDLFLAGMDIPT